MSEPIAVGTLVIVVDTSFAHLLGQVGPVVEIIDATDGGRYHVQLRPCGRNPTGRWRARRSEIAPITPPDSATDADAGVPVDETLLPAPVV